MTEPLDIAGLCVESGPARTRRRAAMWVHLLQPGHAAQAVGVLFNLWDSPPAWFDVPSLDLQPSIAHALVTSAGVAIGEALGGAHNDEGLVALVRGAFTAAEEGLRSLAKPKRILYAGSGAMAVAVAVNQDRAAIGWVGCARAYLVRNGAVELLTRDHTLRQEAATAGMSAAEIEALPDVVVRALGMREDGVATVVDVVCREIQVGDALVLVTEHVHRSVDMAALGPGIAAAEDASAVAAVVMASALGKSPGNALGVVVVKRSVESSSPAHRR